MTNVTTKPKSSQPHSETAVDLFDNWFDPIDVGVRDRVHEFIHTMIEGRARHWADAAALGLTALRPGALMAARRTVTCFR